MAGIPSGFVAYKRTPVFDQTSLPAGLRRRHQTKAQVWGVINVVEGRLAYRTLDPVSETMLDAAHPGIIEAEKPHEVEPQGAVRFFIEFYRDGASSDERTGTLHG